MNEWLNPFCKHSWHITDKNLDQRYKTVGPEIHKRDYAGPSASWACVARMEAQKRPSEPAATSSVALVAKSLTVEDIIT